jgi:hypothetical protein
MHWQPFTNYYWLKKWFFFHFNLYFFSSKCMIIFYCFSFLLAFQPYMISIQIKLRAELEKKEIIDWQMYYKRQHIGEPHWVIVVHLRSFYLRQWPSLVLLDLSRRELSHSTTRNIIKAIMPLRWLIFHFFYFFLFFQLTN